MSMFMKFGNLFVRLILMSPLHGLMSKNTILIHYTGRRSGKQYITPTNYTREGDIIRVSSKRDRVWWRNLKQNPSVTVTLAGELRQGSAVVLEKPEEAAAGFARYLEPAPHFARYYQISQLADGQFDPEDLHRAAVDGVIVEISFG